MQRMFREAPLTLEHCLQLLEIRISSIAAWRAVQNHRARRTVRCNVRRSVRHAASRPSDGQSFEALRQRCPHLRIARRKLSSTTAQQYPPKLRASIMLHSAQVQGRVAHRGLVAVLVDVVAQNFPLGIGPGSVLDALQ